MALPVPTQTFTDADGVPLTSHSANWTLNTGNFAINTNALRGNFSGESGAHWNADTFDDNQYAEATIVAVGGAGVVGVAVRAHATANTYYGMYGRGSSGGELFKMVASVWTQLGSDRGVFTTNLLLRLQVIGDQIIVKYDGVQNGAAETDSAIASGFAGVSSWDPDTGNRLDGWTAGNTTVTPTAALTGTMLSAATEDDIVAGGKTVIITLTGATWIP